MRVMPPPYEMVLDSDQSYRLAPTNWQLTLLPLLHFPTKTCQWPPVSYLESHVLFKNTLLTLMPPYGDAF